MTSTSSYPSVQFGAMLIGSPETQGRINTLKDAQEVLDILRAHEVDSIDTARFYGNGSSEKYLGELKAQEQGFKISTKLMPILGTPLAGLPNISNNQYDHGAQSVHAACQASLDDLKMEKIDIYYLHAPDKNTQFKEVNTYLKRSTRLCFLLADRILTFTCASNSPDLGSNRSRIQGRSLRTFWNLKCRSLLPLTG